MTVVGSGPEYQAFMKQWMKDCPGPWHQCEKCLDWRMTTNPNGHCPCCPTEVKQKETAMPWRKSS